MIPRIVFAVVRRILGTAVAALDLIVPKKVPMYVFVVGAGNAFSGNIKAAHDYYREKHGRDVFLLAHPSSDLTLCESGDAEPAGDVTSLRGLWTLLRASALFIEYWSGDWYWPGILRSRRTIMNLWHGIPIKRMGIADGNRSSVREAARIGYMIASSHIDRSVMAASFGVEYPNVLMTGYPRNDWLVSDDAVRRSPSLARTAADVVWVKNGRRLVLYAPTYRGHHLSSGADVSGVYAFTNDELDRLRSLLVSRNAVLGVRPHINRGGDDRLRYDDVIIDMSRAVFKDVQMLLRHTDVLVSDYSGVWVDYLLLDRPVIGFAYDWEAYAAERGYIYDYFSIFPGPMVRSFGELIDALEQALTGTPAITERQRFVKGMFHAFPDGTSCERLYRSLEERRGR